MIAYLWAGGRLAWPIVVFAVWCTLVVLGADLSWRLVSMRSVKLAAWLGGVWVAGDIVIFALAYWLK
jgi:hypothetical protein